MYYVNNTTHTDGGAGEMKLLINEHDPMVRQFLIGRAEELGVRVTFTGGDGELRDALDDEPPDCVVLDASSSASDEAALPLWQQLRQDPGTSQIPILIYASSSRWQTVAETAATNAQVDAFLPRPFTTDTLVDAAQRIARA
jgi:CheY-like chemotaxis protein